MPVLVAHVVAVLGACAGTVLMAHVVVVRAEPIRRALFEHNQLL